VDLLKRSKKTSQEEISGKEKKGEVFQKKESGKEGEKPSLIRKEIPQERLQEKISSQPHLIKEEPKNFWGISPKVSFVLGLAVGIAIFSLIGFVLLLSLFLKSAALVNNTNKETPEVQAPAIPQAPEEEIIDALKLSPVGKDDYIRGEPNAPITLIEFSDFECPYSALYAETLEKVIKDYKGKVRLVFRHYPLDFHQNAQKASEAVECAGEQGKFWEMHDRLFELNKEGNFSVDNFKKAAKELGLQVSKFNDCLDLGKYTDKVKNNLAEGQEAGVQGTPTTFINGEAVVGALPYDQIKNIIERLLE